MMFQNVIVCHCVSVTKTFCMRINYTCGSKRTFANANAYHTSLSLLFLSISSYTEYRSGLSVRSDYHLSRNVGSWTAALMSCDSHFLRVVHHQLQHSSAFILSHEFQAQIRWDSTFCTCVKMLWKIVMVSAFMVCLAVCSLTLSPFSE